MVNNSPEPAQGKPQEPEQALSPEGQQKPSGKKTDYAKWLGVVATFLSVGLAGLSYSLDQERRTAEQQLELSEIRQEELSTRLEEIRSRSNVRLNYYFEGASSVLDTFNSSTSTHQVFADTLVYKQLLDLIQREGWNTYNNLMRCVYGIHEGSSQGMLNSRQILYLTIFNEAAPDSRNPEVEAVELTYRFNDFDEIPRYPNRQASFTELDVEAWETDTMVVADTLGVNHSITVPVAHMMGPYVFGGRVMIVTGAAWHNPLLDETEEMQMPIRNVLAELEAKALTHGSQLGNIADSCN